MSCIVVALGINDDDVRVLISGGGRGQLTDMQPMPSGAHVRPHRPGGPEFVPTRRRFDAPDASVVGFTTKWRPGCIGWSLAP
jgi:hypothetical protein